MVDFGWSASCLLEAIKLSNKIRKALHDAGGAKDEYAEAMSFLTQTDCVFKELESHIQDNPNSSYRKAIEDQLKLMGRPWTRLEELLSKYEASLGENASRSKLQMAPRKIQWALKDLNDAVSQARDEVLGPLQMVSCLLQMHSMNTVRSTNEKCQKIIDDLQSADLSRALEKGFNDLGLQNHAQSERQTEIRTSLVQLHHSLSQQYANIQDALTANNVLIKQQYENQAAVESAQQEELLVSTSKGIQTPTGQETSIDAIHAQLRAQQASLEKIHEALDCLISESHESTSAAAGGTQDTAQSLQVADAISIVHYAATATSMILLVCAMSSRAPAATQNAPFPLPESSSSYTYALERFGSNLSPPKPKPKAPNMWGLTVQREFMSTFRNTAIGHPYSMESKAAEKELSDQTWFCCGCRDGPIASWMGSCGNCAHTICTDCSTSTERIFSSKKEAQSPCTSPISINPCTSPISISLCTSPISISPCTSSISISNPIPIEVKPPHEESGMWTCSECGLPNLLLWNACPACGACILDKIKIDTQ